MNEAPSPTFGRRGSRVRRLREFVTAGMCLLAAPTGCISGALEEPCRCGSDCNDGLICLADGRAREDCLPSDRPAGVCVESIEDVSDEELIDIEDAQLGELPWTKRDLGVDFDDLGDSTLTGTASGSDGSMTMTTGSETTGGHDTAGTSSSDASSSETDGSDTDGSDTVDSSMTGTSATATDTDESTTAAEDGASETDEESSSTDDTATTDDDETTTGDGMNDGETESSDTTTDANDG